MIRRPRSAALMGAWLASVTLAGCNLSIDNSAAGSGSGSTQGSSSGTGSAQYSIGGTISGLSQNGLSLESGSNRVAVSAGATSFTLPNLVASGATYSVSVAAQPLGQTCSARNESGTVQGASITSVTVTCTINTYPIGGIITGLNADGLVLVNGTDTLSVPLGTSAYMMPMKQAMGATFDITVQTQPTGLTCQVSSTAMGTMPAAAISNVNITCGQWTWIGGANATGSAGSYGSLGVAAAGNAPSARSGAVAWTDHSGMLWLFGGAGGGGSLNDLWEFNPGNSLWTWIGGSSMSNATGQYGSLGTESGTNMPGARSGATGWVDSGGNLWLFGGQGYDGAGTSGSLDDLWEYDMTHGKWIWVAGESTAYATGDPLPTGEPGARSGASGWVDSGGNLWLFGGTGTQLGTGTQPGPTNDLWKYAAGGGGWTLQGGSQTPSMNGVYGAEGTAAATNVPGSRALASALVDASGNFWLFGGQGYAAIGASGLLNDLWMFSPGSGQWTWMGGWKTVNAAGVYGTRSTTDVNLPGARAAAMVSADASGNLWLFGGSGYDVNDAQGSLGDLWEYEVGAAQWIWMGGSQTASNVGSYGTQGTGALGDAPGARSGGIAWMDSVGDFWLLGGQGLATTKTAGELNDLWQFMP